MNNDTESEYEKCSVCDTMRQCRWCGDLFNVQGTGLDVDCILCDSCNEEL